MSMRLNPFRTSHLGVASAIAAVMALVAGCGADDASTTTAADAATTGAAPAASSEADSTEAGSGDSATTTEADSEESGTTTETSAGAGDAMASTLEFIEAGEAPEKAYRIAYLTACINNPYCQTQLKGAQDAAKKYGASIKVFDANFTPATELKNVQDAVSQDFDGYLFVPVADASGCASFKLLQKTEKPVVTANSPMCGNPDYTPETVGFVAMQTQSYFDAHVDNAFKSCSAPCEAMAIGGFVGSDLFTRWENAIKKAAAKYPNVKVVVDQPGNFDPRVALQKTQDALRAHPNIELVVSSWDDMTRGVVQGIQAAGKAPGTDVRIYSVGATKIGVEAVKAGTWTETTVLLPYEETYYPMAQLIRKLDTDTDTPGFANLAEAPPVLDGPGSIFITKDNADQFEPEY